MTAKERDEWVARLERDADRLNSDAADVRAGTHVLDASAEGYEEWAASLKSLADTLRNMPDHKFDS